MKLTTTWGFVSKPRLWAVWLPCGSLPAAGPGAPWGSYPGGGGRFNDDLQQLWKEMERKKEFCNQKFLDSQQDDSTDKAGCRGPQLGTPFPLFPSGTWQATGGRGDPATLANKSATRTRHSLRNESQLYLYVHIIKTSRKPTTYVSSQYTFQ